MTELFSKIITVILMSGLKFLPMPFISVNVFSFSYFQTIIYTIIGGWIGILFFYLTSEYIMKKYKERKIKKEKEYIKKGIPIKRKKYFTAFNKFIVKTKLKFGLLGLAIVTPPIISIPIGAILAAKYYKREKYTLAGLLISVVGWSFVLTTAAYFFEIKAIQ